ncbi:hypothetical protein ACVOMT_10225 [Sphingomonas panni]
MLSISASGPQRRFFSISLPATPPIALPARMPVAPPPTLLPSSPPTASPTAASPPPFTVREQDVTSRASDVCTFGPVAATAPDAVATGFGGAAGFFCAIAGGAASAVAAMMIATGVNFTIRALLAERMVSSGLR